jgi:hypothetical protein
VEKKGWEKTTTPPIAEGIALKKFPTKRYDTFLLR